MRTFEWEQFKNLFGLLATDRPEPVRQAERIVKMLRDVVLPAKAGVSLVVLYYLFYSQWSYEEKNAVSVALDTLKGYFLIYLLCNFLGAILFISWRRLPPEVIQWLAFVLGLLDGIFMGGMTIATGGFSSIVFWVFPGLIVLNALTIPLAMPQFVLNLLLSLFYMGAVLLAPQIGWEMATSDTQVLANMSLQVRAGIEENTNRAAAGPGGVRGTNQTARLSETLARIKRNAARNPAVEENPAEEVVTEQLVLRLAVLWLLTVCCYGTQVLLERQRQAMQEAAEFAAREGQLHSAGRLAAEFAHQIKNPLAIINNAAYSLGRALDGNKKSTAQQIEIIQEEVARADKVITQIMGYAQLSEGRVERLKVVEEVERAGEQVFPSAMPIGAQLRKQFTGPFPPLFMQRTHLAEILVNLLLNAREAAGETGQVAITAVCDRDQCVEITVADNGPGIPPDRLGRIFEAYFTTKEKGTGLGLAIVKHNAELYGGSVRVESVLGKGASFTVVLPAKLQPKSFSQ